jgi:hypothetical protein
MEVKDPCLNQLPRTWRSADHDLGIMIGACQAGPGSPRRELPDGGEPQTEKNLRRRRTSDGEEPQTRRRKTTFVLQIWCRPTVEPEFGASHIMPPPA